MNATSIQCPHCEGDGFTEYDATESCPVCVQPDGRSDGWLDLPLTGEQADRIYDAACQCCTHLVSGDYDLAAVYLPPDARPILGPIPTVVIEDVTAPMEVR